MEYVDFLDVNYNPWLGKSPLLLSPRMTLYSSGKLTQNRINYVKKLYRTIISALNISLNLNSSKSPLPYSYLPICGEFKPEDLEQRSFFTYFWMGRLFLPTELNPDFALVPSARPWAKWHRPRLCFPELLPGRKDSSHAILIMHGLRKWFSVFKVYLFLFL